MDEHVMRMGFESEQILTRLLLDYYHILFGTDMPFDSQIGDRAIRQTMLSIKRMEIPDSEKKIFEDNAEKLLRLPV